MRNDYSAKIIESSRELSNKEKVMFKDTSSCVKLNDVCLPGEDVTINVDLWVVLEIHNEKTQDKDYRNFILVDRDGTKYVTGSQGFWNTFCDIWDDMEDCNEDWSLNVFRRPSKNYSGKEFLTCCIC